MFWTSLTYLLSAEPFSYSAGRIGLLGLAGAAGALAVRRAGALHDRGWSAPATGAALGLLALSLVAGRAASGSLIALVVVIVVLDVAVQGTVVLGQARLFALPGSARSRLNTALVVCNFLGGAIGSALTGPLWALGGWTAIMAVALGITLVGLLVWTLTRRGRLVDTGAADAQATPHADKARVRASL
ncbi:hypothetical protein [Streptomyces sp. NPDC017673]|uniref:hypothetical protein n=1 Tax=unclassified Streptomyces TaxID=2593676 RepID=UPI003787D7E3